MSSVHCSQQRGTLGTSDLTNDDSVGPHAQTRFQTVVHVNLRHAVRPLSTGFHSQPVVVIDLQLSCVLDRQERRDQGMYIPRQLSVVVFPEPVPPAMTKFAGRLSNLRSRPIIMAAKRELTVPKLTRSIIVSGSSLSFRMVSVGPSGETGGMVPFTREPSSSRPSNGDESRSVAERYVGVRGDVFGDLETGIIVNPNVGSAHAVIPVRHFDALRPPVVHNLLKRIVFKQRSKVSVRVGLDVPVT